MMDENQKLQTSLTIANKRLSELIQSDASQQGDEASFKNVTELLQRNQDLTRKVQQLSQDLNDKTILLTQTREKNAEREKEYEKAMVEARNALMQLNENVTHLEEQ